jgi:hypothetical protein
VGQGDTVRAIAGRRIAIGREDHLGPLIRLGANPARTAPIGAFVRVVHDVHGAAHVAGRHVGRPQQRNQQAGLVGRATGFGPQRGNPAFKRTEIGFIGDVLIDPGEDAHRVVVQLLGQRLDVGMALRRFRRVGQVGRSVATGGGFGWG